MYERMISRKKTYISVCYSHKAMTSEDLKHALTTFEVFLVHDAINGTLVYIYKKTPADSVPSHKQKCGLSGAGDCVPA